MADEQTILQYFVSVLSQIKLYHWATTSYAKHKALDELHEDLSNKVDLFVEAFIGRYKKQPLKVFTIETKGTTDTANTKIEKYLETERAKMVEMSKTFKNASELVNILDDMMALIDKTLYLCNLS
jgi:DNA-binding ferritin-like protein